MKNGSNEIRSNEIRIRRELPVTLNMVPISTITGTGWFFKIFFKSEVEIIKGSD